MSENHIEITPDGTGYQLTINSIPHSWVDLENPTYLEFPYMQQIANIIDSIWENNQRLRVIHAGGGAMTLARYITHTRPTSPQIVLEPDTQLTEKVRKHLPLPKHSGIKIRPQDAKTGIENLPENYAQIVIIDAFDNNQVPAELTTTQFFSTLNTKLTNDGVILFNLSDQSPFKWTKKVLASIQTQFQTTLVTTETPIYKGRRNGNLIVAATKTTLPIEKIQRKILSTGFPHKILYGNELKSWIGKETPYTEENSEKSPPILQGKYHFK